MFGRRRDAYKLKGIDPIVRMTGYIMPYRYDAQVGLTLEIRCEEMDRFIEEQEKLGNKFTYMHIVISGLLRMIALRPKLRRFLMGGRVYSRKTIDFAFAVKKQLTDDAEETTIKVSFTGHEGIFDVKEILDREISKNKVVTEENKTDRMAKLLLSIPHFILKPAVAFLKWTDRCGFLPKAVLEASPFHVSLFLTNMKSLGTNHVLHHLYDFGTTAIFASMGKEKYEPCVNFDKKLEVGKVMKMGFVIDERICDGLYYAKSIKVGKRHIENPELLMERLETVLEDPELKKKKSKNA